MCQGKESKSLNPNSGVTRVIGEEGKIDIRVRGGKRHSLVSNERKEANTKGGGKEL